MVFQYTPTEFLNLPPFQGNKEIVRNYDSFERMVHFLELSPFITFDTETSGTAWYRHASICGVSFSGILDNAFKCFYIPFRHKTGETQLSFSKCKNGLKKLLENDRLKIAHNFKFDEHMLRKEGISINGPRYDTMIAAHIYNENVSAALKNRAVSDLNIKDAQLYEQAVDIKLKELAKLNNMKITEYKYQFGYSHLPIDLCGIYACYDVDFTTQLYWFYERNRISTDYSRVFNTEMDLLGVLCDMEENGMPIDTDYLFDLKSKLQIVKSQIEENLFHNMRIRNFNIASDDELRNFLLNDLALPLTKQTKKFQLSVDSDVLKTFSSYHPALSLISKWKEADKLANTYTDSIVRCMDSKNLVHCDFQQIGTIASRLSCRNPNLQNQPTDDDDRAIEHSGVDLEHNGIDPWSIRRAYIVRDKSWPRIYWDYSQIELRILAYYSQDPVMVQAYLNGEDIHSRTSLEVFGNKDKAFRRLAKVINFGLSYGMTEFHFASAANITVEEARKFLNKFFERYHGVKLFRENLWEYIRNNSGYFTNVFGRPRRIPNINSYNIKDRSRAERQSIATIIQGSAGELTKESLVRIHKAIIAEGLQGLVFPVCTIHDEVQYDCCVDVLPKFCKIVKTVMEDYEEFKPIPIIVDSEYTLTNWSEKRGLKLAA